MTDKRTWSKKDDSTLRRLHAKGLSQAAIAREMGWSSHTIGSRSRPLGLEWKGATRATAAQVARVFDLKEARTDVERRIYGQAGALLDRLEAQTFETILKSMGGEEGEATLDFIPARDYKDMAASLAQLLSQAHAIADRDDDGGATEAAGIVNTILFAVGDSLKGLEPMNPITYPGPDPRTGANITDERRAQKNATQKRRNARLKQAKAA